MPVDYSKLSKGDNIVGYEIIQKLGNSPLRETYEAEHPVLERRVAIKFCTRSKLRNRFLVSARLMSRLDHPHISVLYDAGEIDGVPYIVSEFIQGTHLGDLIGEHESFDLATLLRMMQQVASAIAHAHSRGVLHRNIKPQNIVIDQAGRAILSDFEVAIPIGSEPESIVGTPTYMAPEQVRKLALTEKVDVWGIGATLYSALSGSHVPYSWGREELHESESGSPSLESCQKFFEDRSAVSYECLSDHTPHYVIKILEKCLAFSPGDRWLSAAHLSTALDSAISQFEIDSTTPTAAFMLPSEGQTIVTYTETHGDELSGDYRQFELREMLGDGHSGIVFRAWETFSELEVAIKFLKPEHLLDRDSIQRFRRESKLLAQISHPNVVKLYSQGRYGPTFFIALQLLDGNDLESVLRHEGPLTLSRAMQYGTQILAGVACLHENGITHRDLKPANMGFTSGRLVIGDFGLARNEEVTRITATGTVMGTLAYMAPEQVRGEPATFASDIYSLGAIFYQLLTSKVPHEAPSTSELMHRIQNDPVRELISVRRDVPIEVSKIVASMLSKSSEDRPTADDALEVLGELDRQGGKAG